MEKGEGLTCYFYLLVANDEIHGVLLELGREPPVVDLIGIRDQEHGAVLKP